MEIEERIINEAGTMFSQYGTRSVTMDALAMDMGISKRTIYEHFRDKDTLLLEVVKYFKQRHADEMEQIMNDSENTVEGFFKVLKRNIDNMKRINPAFFHDIKKYHPGVYTDIMEKSDIRDYSLTRNFLGRGMAEEVFDDGYDLEILNITLHELFNLFSPESHLTRQDYNRKELFDNIILPYLRGIATAQGRELIDKYRKHLEQH